MIHVTASLSDKPQTRLLAAYLLYGHQTRYSSQMHFTMATQHEIEYGLQGTHLKPGQHVELAGMVAALRQLVPGQSAFIPEHVFYASEDLLGFWMPAGVKPKHFEHSPELDGFYPHPPLVFIVSYGKIWLGALRDNARPRPETTICHVPYSNMLGQFLVCKGTTHLPEKLDPENTEAWVNAYFASSFTGSGVRLTKSRLSYTDFWQRLQGKTLFPVKQLKPASTLKEMIASCQRHIGATRV
jgi:PRTRC genetic system protein B